MGKPVPDPLLGGVVDRCGALVQQRVYPRRIWRATFCLTGHAANREQQSKFGVDHSDIAHARSVGLCGCRVNFTNLSDVLARGCPARSGVRRAGTNRPPGTQQRRNGSNSAARSGLTRNAEPKQRHPITVNEHAVSSDHIRAHPRPVPRRPGRMRDRGRPQQRLSEVGADVVIAGLLAVVCRSS